MVKYTASDKLLWSKDAFVISYVCNSGPWGVAVNDIVLPSDLEASSFLVKYRARELVGIGTGFAGIHDPNALWGYGGDYISGTAWKDFAYTIAVPTGRLRIQIYHACTSGCSQIEVKNFRVYGSEVYSGTCEPFLWIGDICLTIGQIFRDVGDRMGTVWFVGDIIQAWFNAVAGYFEGAKDWFYFLGSWCGQIVQGLHLGDAWTWVLGFFADPGGYILGFLGDTWTWVQSLYSDFSGAVFNVLGSAWTDLQDLYNNFSARVTNVLGDTWTWVQSLYSDFSGAVFNVLGSAWEDLQDMHSNFGSWVTGALGGTWTWLTEFVEDPMSKLDLGILELVKSGFEWLTQEWFSFIDSSWDNFKGSFEWLLQKLFLLLDESWSDFEESLKWFLGRCMDLVGDAAEDLKYQIWEMVEKVVKRL